MAHLSPMFISQRRIYFAKVVARRLLEPKLASTSGTSGYFRGGFGACQRVTRSRDERREVFLEQARRLESSDDVRRYDV